MEFIIASFILGALIILGAYLFNTVYLPYVKIREQKRDEARQTYLKNLEEQAKRFKQEAEKKSQQVYQITPPIFNPTRPISSMMDQYELERREMRRQMEESKAIQRRLQQEANLRAAQKRVNDNAARAHLPQIRLNPITGQWENVDRQNDEIMQSNIKDILKKGY